MSNPVIQTRAMWMGVAAGGVFLLMSILVFWQAYFAARSDDPSWWSMILPMPFYLYAMGATWWWLRTIGKGQHFAANLAGLLRKAGIALFIGGLVEVFGVNIYLVEIGAGSRTVNLTAVVIGVIGVGLVGIASLIDEARAARAELDEFI